jgi:hypothetical protein
MAIAPRTVVRVTLMAALVVFCGVQDRITAAGARRYVALQRDAVAAGAAPIAIDAVVRPEVSRSVEQGLLWAGVVCVAGLGTAYAIRRRRA